MPDIVTGTAEEIRESARELNLIPVDGSFAAGHMPSLRWTGTRDEFLKLAKSAGARMIYLDLIEFKPADMVVSCVAENLDDFDIADDEDGTDLVDVIYHRLSETIAPWVEREGQVARLVCTWVVDGVAHVWKAEQKWYVECRQAIEQTLDDFYESGLHDVAHV